MKPINKVPDKEQQAKSPGHAWMCMNTISCYQQFFPPEDQLPNFPTRNPYICINTSSHDIRIFYDGNRVFVKWSELPPSFDSFTSKTDFTSHQVLADQVLFTYINLKIFTVVFQSAIFNRLQIHYHINVQINIQQTLLLSLKLLRNLLYTTQKWLLFLLLVQHRTVTHLYKTCSEMWQVINIPSHILY